MTTLAPSIPTPGSRYRSFVIERVLEIPELRLRLIEGFHEPTGAKILHLAADDPENLFCISFRTEPQASHGVAHILEHMVLCGSKKYPVRDPFMSMTRRSLHTFLNALTGSDFTCYPGATCIPQDFNHLLDVYLDAVFQPLLRSESFRQEGWRLESEDLESPEGPLCLRGVVYNEMKGAMASPESRCWKRLMAELYPDLTYRFNSGGDPQDIPDLSVEELREFHRHHYHPGRSILFFYGNLPLFQHLDVVEPHLEGWSEPAAPLPPLPAQPRLTHPKLLTESFPAQQSGAPLFALGWLTAPIQDVDSQLALELLQMTLMGTDASPLKRALMESGLCQDVDSLLEEEMSEAPFVLFFRGLPSPETTTAAEQLTQLTLDTLQKIAQEGLDPDLLRGALDQLELQKLEITGDEGPFGMSLFWRAVLQMQHGATPEMGLGVRAAFQRLRQALEKPDFLPSMIRRWLLDNPHRVGLVMQPDRELASQEAQAERARLTRYEQTLSPEQRRGLVHDAIALREEQRTPQDISCLPSLQLVDIPRNVRSFSLETHLHGAGQVHTHECFTNGMVYADLILPLALPDLQEWPWLRLMAQMLPDLGWGGRSFKETLQDLLAFTGGLSVSWNLYPQAQNCTDWRPALIVRGKALERHAEKMLELMNGMISSPDFRDRERVQELLEQDWSHIETGVSRMANRMAHQLAASRVRASACVEGIAGGLHYVRWLQQLMLSLESSLPAACQKLEQMSTRCQIGPAELILTAEAPLLERLRQAGYQGLLEKVGTLGPNAAPPALSPSDIPAYQIDGRVAFTAQSYETISYTDARSPLLAVASSLMENTSLHTDIRERGGAYGASASVNSLAGVWTFSSYRDPHIHQTSHAFNRAVQKIAAGEFTDQDLLEAQLSTLQSIDSLPAPGLRGMVTWRRLREGLSTEIRQRWKDGVLEAQRASIQEAVEQILLPQLGRWDPVVFAGKEVLDREKVEHREFVLSSLEHSPSDPLEAEETESDADEECSDSG